MTKGPVALVAGLGLSLLAPDASAVLIFVEGPNLGAIAGVTDSETTGDEMGGLAVTATLKGGFSETATWALTGATSGAAVGLGPGPGLGWSLSLDGNTFTADWVFDFFSPAMGTADNLASLFLDARATTTIFDRTFGGIEGTPGSSSGRDWICASAGGGCLVQTFLSNITVTYDYKVGAGDLFQTVRIDFAGAVGIFDDFDFHQDTDSVAPVPEPGTLLLLGTGLSALALRRRRKG